MKKKKSKTPFVTICTATYNRNFFYDQMIENYLNQTYPKEYIEWIIIDDSEDDYEDFFLSKNIKNLRYICLKNKITIGKKRNMLNDLSKGDYIIYMDDDDYYYPSYISYCVKMMEKNKKYMISGCNELYVYFNKIDKIYKFGPYFDNHITAATFCFRKELLETCRFDENNLYAEEKSFLKNYSIPVLKLDPLKTIMVINHNNNTCNKTKLLDNVDKNKFIQEINKNLNTFINNEKICDFYKNIYLNNINENDKKLYYKNEDGTERLIKYNELVDLFINLKQQLEKK